MTSILCVPCIHAMPHGYMYCISLHFEDRMHQWYHCCNLNFIYTDNNWPNTYKVNEFCHLLPSSYIHIVHQRQKFSPKYVDLNEKTHKTELLGYAHCLRIWLRGNQDEVTIWDEAGRSFYSGHKLR